jgi:hypothetical protein
MNRLLLVCLLAGAPALADQAVLLDFSGSMAGFASARATRITGFLQRLGHSLASAGTVRYYGFSARAGQPSVTELPLDTAAVRFAQASQFRGASPLTWAIAEASGRLKNSDLIVLTDGMEDNARLEHVADFFAGYARANWSLGVAAFVMPFDGPYYTELKIPFEEFKPAIEETIRAANANWRIAAATCTDHPTATCYRYTGERPLLAFVLSRSGSLERLFATLRQSAEQLRMPAPSEVVLFPYAPWVAAVSPQLAPAAREILRAPAKMAMGSVNEFECIRPVNSPLPVRLAVSVASSSRLTEATIAVPKTVIVGERAAWARLKISEIAVGANGATHEISVTCLKPGIASILESSTILPGTLRLQYTFHRIPRPEGWWIALSASNSWQYPHKVFHLQQVVERLQAIVLSGEPPKQMQLGIQLRSRR